jgi:hypothetical protein
MVRKIVRTLLVGLITGLLLGLLLLPALDAMGRSLLMPPVYEPAVRVLLAALLLAGMRAAWSYEPVVPGAGEEATEGPPDPSAHGGGP